MHTYEMTMRLLSPICIILLFWILPAWGLVYDFEDKAQLEDWDIIGGEWKIENGVLKGENVPAVSGFDHGPGIVVGKWHTYKINVY